MIDLRPAQETDAPAVATIWADGWPDGHLGHVPDELAAVRTPASFRSRAADRIGDTTVAVVGTGSAGSGSAGSGSAGSGSAGSEIAGSEVAGFVMIVGDEVEQVYVAAAHRGSGVAAVLLVEAERLIAATGYDRAWLAVVAGNARARRFYERNGWTDDGPFDYAATVHNGTIAVPCHRYVKRL